jgi:putative restriction endonuclease
MVDAILDAIEESGCSGILIGQARANPRKFIISLPDGDSLSVWVYIWTVTHGGRPNLPDEYRIQMTSVTSPLPRNPTPIPTGHTVLMGYYPDLQVFAGFDLRRHDTFSEGSPSVQIGLAALRQALQDGLSFDRKENDEIAIGVRPDHFVSYVRNAEKLHRDGTDARTFKLLAAAAAVPRLTSEEEARLDSELTSLALPRQEIVQEVRRLSRDGNFRQQVLRAYGYRCAVTGVQLRLIDAAHILPVGVPGSIDHVRNGVALAPTYHRAYDARLIFLDKDHIMRINPEREVALRALNLVQGIDTFKQPLGRRIHLPPDRNQWPGPEFIRKANQHRRIQRN